MTFGRTKFEHLIEQQRERNKKNKMKTHRTCDECRNSKPYDEEEYPLLCTKTGIQVCENDCCENFVPKQAKDCKNCKFNVSFCIKRNTRINHIFGFRDFCSDFELKEIANKLEIAAKKAATTGNRSDLQEYLKLRREML